MAKSALESDRGDAVQNMSAKDAKYGFGRLIDLARSEPVVVEKHGRPVVVVLAVEEFDRLKAIEAEHRVASPASDKGF
jgi:prevent-host-death family protein